MNPWQVISALAIQAALVLTACTAAAEEPVDFRISFEWTSQPTLTISKAAIEDKVVLSIDVERFPVRRVPALLDTISASGAVEVAAIKLFDVNGDAKHAAISCRLQPIALSATGDALEHLHSVLNFHELTIDVSLSNLSRAQLIDLLRPSESQPALDQLRRELNKVMDGKLSSKANEPGWVIEIQGYHYYGTDGQSQ